MWNKLFSYSLAGLMGGLMVLGGMTFLQSDQTTTPEELPSQAGQFVHLPSTSTSTFPTDFRDAAKASMSAVVHIKATETSKETGDLRSNPFSFFFGDSDFGLFGPKSGMGSGVIYSDDGFIITNNHVVDFADKVEVTLYDNRKFMATVVGTDDKTDLAVLKIEATDLPAIKISDSDDVHIGDWVLAVGNPFDLTSTVTAGIVSAKGRSLHMMDKNGIESFIQTDAAVNPGNSGGALVNTNGELIGINTAIASQTGSFAGYSFAIPVNIVTRVVDNLIQFGSPKRGLLGVMISDMDADIAEELKINVVQGAYVSELVNGGAAQMAGMLPDDVIVEANGQPIKNVPDLMKVIGGSNEGDWIRMKVNRHGKEKEISAKLKG